MGHHILHKENLLGMKVVDLRKLFCEMTSGSDDDDDDDDKDDFGYYYRDNMIAQFKQDLYNKTSPEKN